MDFPQNQSRAWPWIKRILGTVTAILIFIWMIRPVVQRWDSVKPYVRETNIPTFLIACAMFTIFLFFRAMTWRRIIKGFGHVLPIGTATRIWSSSELARYIPGSVMQFAGRVYLAKPYGIPRAATITSQILELSAFLLANVIVAVGSLLWYGGKLDHDARKWFIAAMALLPALSLLLHPKIFYGIVNGFRSKRGKEPIIVRLHGNVLIALLFGMLVALVWQGMAIWLLTHEALSLQIGWWWRVAGAYCLAWCAGFLVVFSSGGLGVRELVFYLVLREILPAQIKNHFPDEATLKAYLKFLGVLLRLWTIIGELALWAIAMIWDYRGAMGKLNQPAPSIAPENP